MPIEIDVYSADSGKILKEILKPGDGELVACGASVIVDYTGTFPDGSIFDSSRNRCGTFQFNVGVGEVIAGWDIAICSMKQGEHVILTIDPKYAYGAEGNPPSIPPNTVLKFNVKILNWKYEDLSPNKNGSIEKRHTTEPGTGYLNPRVGAYINVHINGKFGSEVFEDRDIIFRLDYQTEDNVAGGVKLALRKFKKGEQSTVFVWPKHAYNAPCFKDIDLPTHGIVEYDIKLKCFEKLAESWSLDEDEKIQISEMFKEKGNQYFSQKKYEDAIELYQKVLEYSLENDGEQIITDDEYCSKLVLSAYLNTSLCYLKTFNYEKARDSALRAIFVASDNDKAHYRCGLALLGLSDNEKAKHHFEICLKINPNNSEAKTQLSQTMENIKKSADKEKKRYQNMFKKFPELDVEQEEKESNES